RHEQRPTQRRLSVPFRSNPSLWIHLEDILDESATCLSFGCYQNRPDCRSILGLVPRRGTPAAADRARAGPVPVVWRDHVFPGPLGAWRRDDPSLSGLAELSS